VDEWFKSAVLKTAGCNRSVSSNLTASAKFSLVLMAARLSPKQKVAVRVRSGMPVLPHKIIFLCIIVTILGSSIG